MFDKMTTKDLRALLLKTSIEAGNDNLFHFNSKTKKKDLVGMIEEHESLQKEDETSSFAQVDSDHQILNLSQIKVNPFNIRHELDYNDESYVNRIVQNNGLIHDIVVTPHKDIDPDADDSYIIVSGNRSYRALCDTVVNRWDKDLETFEIVVKVRTYKGSPKQRIAQMLVEINGGNAGLKPTAIDMLTSANHLRAQGLKNKVIAKQLGISAPYLSQILTLNNLTKALRDQVHFGQQKDHLSNLPIEQLEAYGVDYIVHNNEIKVYGLDLTKAIIMAKQIRKKPNKTASSEEIEEWIDNRDLVRRYLSHEDVINSAKTMNTKPFEIWLIKFLKTEYGYSVDKISEDYIAQFEPQAIQEMQVSPNVVENVEDEEPETVEQVGFAFTGFDEEEEDEDEVNDLVPEVSSTGLTWGDVAVKSQSLAAQHEEHEVVEQKKAKIKKERSKPQTSKVLVGGQKEIKSMFYNDPTAFAYEVDAGNYDITRFFASILSPTWAEDLSKGLANGDRQAYQLCKMLVDNGVFEIID